MRCILSQNRNETIVFNCLGKLIQKFSIGDRSVQRIPAPRAEDLLLVIEATSGVSVGKSE